MLGRIFTVGGYTLLSRLTGFARDIMLAAILGADPSELPARPAFASGQTFFRADGEADEWRQGIDAMSRSAMWCRCG